MAGKFFAKRKYEHGGNIDQVVSLLGGLSARDAQDLTTRWYHRRVGVTAQNEKHARGHHGEQVRPEYLLAYHRCRNGAVVTGPTLSSVPAPMPAPPGVPAAPVSACTIS